MKNKTSWLLVLLLALTPSLVFAKAKTKPAPAEPVVPAEVMIPAGVASVETKALQATVIEAATGTVLYAKDADKPMPTSSMSKVMTTYMVFDAIKNGKLRMDATLPVSEYAWKQEGSRMFVNVGEQVKVEDLIRGVIIQSGNDAAVVLAEGLGGSEANFAEMMNSKAHTLGLHQSHFRNATGMPDPQHYSTARDLAMLALAEIRDFPEHYHYYAEKEFTYNGIKQGNRNPLLYRNIGVDGLKTGHTEAAGFGLMASSVRDGRRLVLVVNGLKDMQERADESALLLDWAYREFGLYPIVKKDEVMGEVPVFMGVQPKVALVAGQDAVLSLPRSSRNGLSVSLVFNQPVPAPIVQGAPLGKVVITAPGMTTMEVPLLAGASVDQLGFFARAIFKIKHFFGKS